MNDVEFLAAQHRYLHAPRGLKLKRLAELKAVTKRLLKPARRRLPRRRAG